MRPVQPDAAAGPGAEVEPERDLPKARARRVKLASPGSERMLSIAAPSSSTESLSFHSEMLNIVVPMAGLGSRFAGTRYTMPKPLIPVHGIPMIRLVIGNVRPNCPHRFVFICQRAHVRDHDLERRLAEWAPGCAVIKGAVSEQRLSG